MRECCIPWTPIYTCTAPSVHPSNFYLWAALSPPWTPKLGRSPSQRIVCLNWKVGWGKPTNVANHFKTTFHLFPPFFYQAPSFSSEREKESEGERQPRKRERDIERWWGWCWWHQDDYMWAMQCINAFTGTSAVSHDPTPLLSPDGPLWETVKEAPAEIRSHGATALPQPVLLPSPRIRWRHSVIIIHIPRDQTVISNLILCVLIYLFPYLIGASQMEIYSM